MVVVRPTIIRENFVNILHREEKKQQTLFKLFARNFNSMLYTKIPSKNKT